MTMTKTPINILVTNFLAIFTLAFVVETTVGVLPTAEIHVFSDGRGASNSRSQKENDSKIWATEARYGPRPVMIGRGRGSRNEETKAAATRLMVPPTDDPLLCDEPLPTPKSSNKSPEDERSLTGLSSSSSSSSAYKDAIILVPRGECTYMRKTLAAQALGAKGVIIRNTLESHYTVNKTAHQGERYPSYNFKDIQWPVDKHDYDCDFGQASIPSADLSFDPLPYNSRQNDPLLSGDIDKNLCKLYSDDNLRNCPSKRCLITHDDYDPTTSNSTNHRGDATMLQACCAWDLYVEPVGDYDLWHNYTVLIPSVFVTMKEGDHLLSLLQSSGQDVGSTGVMVSVFARWESTYNISALLIWMLGVAVCGLAAYLSASEYHRGVTYYLKRMYHRGTSSVARSRSQSQRQQRPNNELQHRSSMAQEERLALEPIHAVMFVIMASTSLLVLFYFKIYGIVKVMYAFGCSNAVIQVIVYPVVTKLLSSKYCNQRERVLWRSQDLGDVTNWDCLSAFIGYCWGMGWLYMALFIPHAADTSTFFWVTQDILGACMCITFLGLIQLNSIRVASILLIVAFFYDIFFVFVSPLIFKKSVMITVATSGGPPKADALWCEKYPSDKDCQGGDPLPMLLAIPKLLDYQPGITLLGLGDIVLPGLLLSFACRLDAAKYLVALAGGTDKSRRSTIEGSGTNDNLEEGQGDEQDGVMTSNVPNAQNAGAATLRRVSSSSSSNFEPNNSHAYPDAHQVQSTMYSSWLCCLCAWASYHWYGNSEPTALSALLCGGGGYYFLPVCIAYAVGLLMANVAVYVMHMGQPALLYLVPCTLGTICYLGWRRQELHSLWEGPKVFLTADKIMSGGRRLSSPQSHDNNSKMSQATTNVKDQVGGDNALNSVEEDVDEGELPLLATNPKGGVVE